MVIFNSYMKLPDGTYCLDLRRISFSRKLRFSSRLACLGLQFFVALQVRNSQGHSNVRGFLEMGVPGVPKMDGSQRRIQLKMDDEWGYPYPNMA